MKSLGFPDAKLSCWRPAVILYNVPSRTAVDLLPATVARLAALPRDDAMAGVDTARVRWLGHHGEIGTAGATVRGQYLWKWLMAAVLVGLLLELALIRWMRPSVVLSAPAASSAMPPVGSSAA